jgi:hypothetical protein
MWTLRIIPDHVQDLGHQFLQPQIQWADQLLVATGSKASAAADLASSSVIAYLRHTELDADAIDKCAVHKRGRKGDFEISFGVGTKLWLAYELRNGRPYFTKVRVE